ncbi:MAG TPA: endonuclease Q family protein [Nitrospinota bacterium]|nr:endonuclease Q family protein [Nitrospinota bacterium]
MKFIADFHIHSKYSRATSKEMEVEALGRWAKKKGIDLMGTGDFTHPFYLSELKTKLEPKGNGLFQLKRGDEKTDFILTGEVSNIYHQGGRLRKIHTVVFAPSIKVVEKINTKLAGKGKLSADGRPIFGFSAKNLVKLVLDISEECLLVPAHAWTPWFSLFGANSGFDSLEECFEEEVNNIYAIETGLSSDPSMNWRLSQLDRICLISNSDAHSPQKIGREANVFDCERDYRTIMEVIKNKDRQRFLFTIEFYPEEGKYHYDGHRNCQILFSPKESQEVNNICPVCKKALTIGVMHRVDDLADREEGFKPENSIPARYVVPLGEIIADAFGVSVGTKAVDNEYDRLIEWGGSEFKILLDIEKEELSRYAHPKVSEGVMRVREGKFNIVPGYDGVFGKIKIFEESKEQGFDEDEQKEQMNLF